MQTNVHTVLKVMERNGCLDIQNKNRIISEAVSTALWIRRSLKKTINKIINLLSEDNKRLFSAFIIKCVRHLWCRAYLCL